MLDVHVLVVVGRQNVVHGLEIERAAITNVTDEDPPYLNIAPANTDTATYRLLGRTYFLKLSYRFE